MKMKVIMKGLTLSAILVAAGVVTGCEEIQKAVDREAEQLQQNIAAKEESFLPLAGTYRGTLKHDASAKSTTQADDREVVLVLVPTTIIVQNPGRNDISQFPSLGGSLSVIIDSLVDGEESSIPIAHYDSAVWKPETGKLRLNGTISSASAGLIHVYLEGTFENDHIVARAHSSLKGLVGTIDVSRVIDEPAAEDVSATTH